MTFFLSLVIMPHLMRSLRAAHLGLILCLICSAPVFAAKIEGFLGEIKPKENTIRIYDPFDTGAFEEMYYGPQTKFTDVTPETLREGMFLVVEGEQDPFSGDWKVFAITPNKQRSKPDSMPAKEQLAPAKS